jgi:hypothetical protein
MWAMTKQGMRTPNSRTGVSGRPYSFRVVEGRVMHRYLVVADLAGAARELKDFVQSRDGTERSRFHLVVPTIPGRRRLTWEETEAHLDARKRLAHGLEWMREFDPRADGEVGDIDPMLAIEDALQATQYDSIVLAIRWRRHRREAIAARARRAFDLPVLDVLDAPDLPARSESRQIARRTA